MAIGAAGDDSNQARFAAARKGFRFRRPLSDLLLRWLVVVVPLALAAIAGLIGVEFQKHSDSFTDDGLSGAVAAHLSTLRGLTATLGTIGVVGLVAMALWSGLIVTNTNRVGFSLRTPWFAAIGWLIAPGLGVGAHVTLDKHLGSGSAIGITVFLAVLYLPFGTLGGAADDLGGSPHLARTWFLASVIGAFLLIVGISGATSGLPIDDPQNVLKVRAFSCYLSALMLLASAALAFATARNLNALIGHKWAREDDPERLLNDPDRLKISRSGRKLRRRLTPTLFLRVIVATGLLGTGVASVAIVFVLRGRYLRLNAASPERALVLDDIRTFSLSVATVGIAVHAVYVMWAIVAARNAYRRSIMAPNPWAVVSALLGGPVVVVASTFLTGPFGAAVLTVGLILVVSGFVVAQLVLDRTVAVLGGRGRIFIVWLVVDVAMCALAAVISVTSTNRIQIVAFGVAQTALAMLGAVIAWTAMTRLDRCCRDYRHSGAIQRSSAAGSQPPPTGRAVVDDSARAAQPASFALTSTHS